MGLEDDPVLLGWLIFMGELLNFQGVTKDLHHRPPSIAAPWFAFVARGYEERASHDSQGNFMYNICTYICIYIYHVQDMYKVQYMKYHETIKPDKLMNGHLHKIYEVFELYRPLESWKPKTLTSPLQLAAS